MALADPAVFVTEHNDGSADMTISIDGDGHKFSVSGEGSQAVVSYDETLSWRGQIRVSEPREEVWKILMTSDQMTAFLESNDLGAVRRER